MITGMARPKQRGFLSSQRRLGARVVAGVVCAGRDRLVAGMVAARVLLPDGQDRHERHGRRTRRKPAE
jgi:hypothetical protein